MRGAAFVDMHMSRCSDSRQRYTANTAVLAPGSSVDLSIDSASVASFPLYSAVSLKTEGGIACLPRDECMTCGGQANCPRPTQDSCTLMCNATRTAGPASVTVIGPNGNGGTWSVRLDLEVLGDACPFTTAAPTPTPYATQAPAFAPLNYTAYTVQLQRTLLTYDVVYGSQVNVTMPVFNDAGVVVQPQVASMPPTYLVMEGQPLSVPPVGITTPWNFVAGFSLTQTHVTIRPSSSIPASVLPATVRMVFTVHVGSISRSGNITVLLRLQPPSSSSGGGSGGSSGTTSYTFAWTKAQMLTYAASIADDSYVTIDVPAAAGLSITPTPLPTTYITYPTTGPITVHSGNSIIEIHRNGWDYAYNVTAGVCVVSARRALSVSGLAAPAQMMFEVMADIGGSRSAPVSVILYISKPDDTTSYKISLSKVDPTVPLQYTQAASSTGLTIALANDAGVTVSPAPPSYAPLMYFAKSAQVEFYIPGSASAQVMDVPEGYQSFNLIRESGLFSVAPIGIANMVTAAGGALPAKLRLHFRVVLAGYSVDNVFDAVVTIGDAPTPAPSTAPSVVTTTSYYTLTWASSSLRLTASTLSGTFVASITSATGLSVTPPLPTGITSSLKFSATPAVVRATGMHEALPDWTYSIDSPTGRVYLMTGNRWVLEFIGATVTGSSADIRFSVFATAPGGFRSADLQATVTLTNDGLASGTYSLAWSKQSASYTITASPYPIFIDVMMEAGLSVTPTSGPAAGTALANVHPEFMHYPPEVFDSTGAALTIIGTYTYYKLNPASGVSTVYPMAVLAGLGGPVELRFWVLASIGSSNSAPFAVSITIMPPQGSGSTLYGISIARGFEADPLTYLSLSTARSFNMAPIGDAGTNIVPSLPSSAGVSLFVDSVILTYAASSASGTGVLASTYTLPWSNNGESFYTLESVAGVIILFPSHVRNILETLSSTAASMQATVRFNLRLKLTGISSGNEVTFAALVTLLPAGTPTLAPTATPTAAPTLNTAAPAEVTYTNSGKGNVAGDRHAVDAG